MVGRACAQSGLKSSMQGKFLQLAAKGDKMEVEVGGIG